MAHVKKMDKIVPLMPCLCFVFFRLAADEEVGAGEAVGDTLSLPERFDAHRIVIRPKQKITGYLPCG
mgnify:CR=1 FL=1